MIQIEKHLRCPDCNQAGKIAFLPDLRAMRGAACEVCGYSLPVYGGIPDFAGHIPLADPDLRPIQKLNNSRVFARLYETAVWRAFLTHLGAGMSMRQELHDVLEMSEKGPAGAIADLACGTGHYARAFARKLPEAAVFGLDISPGMLLQGRKMAIERGLCSIMFLRGDIYRLPFEDGCIARVNCCGALHLFSELTPIWREISRVLKPGGVFTGWVLIALSRWLDRKIQGRLMSQGKATFFDPGCLAADLEAVGLTTFKFVKHRAWLIFRAVKDE